MRLYDKLLTIPGTTLDNAFFGAFSKLAIGLRQAQCFLMSADLAAACEEVSWSRPSSILSAQSRLRIPYQHTWIEWVSADRLKEHTRVNDKPKPLRMGCYIHANKEGTKGTVHYLWEHKLTPEAAKHYDIAPEELQEFSDIPEITLNPFGIIFDWSENSEPAMIQYAKAHGLELSPEQIALRYDPDYSMYKKAMLDTEKWRSLVSNERELEAYKKLDLSSGIVPLEICNGLFNSPIFKDRLKPGRDMYEAFMEDLSGEFIYLEAFLIMLNTKNKVISQNREDLSRLNKARAKRKKPLFKEFIITNLNLNKTHTTRAGITGISRAEARRHLVRGHFKTRSSGVYWYSAHMRSHGENSPVARKHYGVDIERRPE